MEQFGRTGDERCFLGDAQASAMLIATTLARNTQSTSGISGANAAANIMRVETPGLAGAETLDETARRSEFGLMGH